MTNKEYKSIRGERDFLYRFFIKEGGYKLGDQQFSVYLNFWISSMGLTPQQAIPQIVNYLDKKFA